MNTPESPFKTHAVAYSPERARRRVYASSAFMVLGLFLCLLVVMFRPGGAVADLPPSVNVFPKFDSTTGATVKFSDAQKLTADYDIVLNGEKQPSKISLTGVPLVELLKAGGVDVSGVGFAKVRLGAENDSSIALIPLDQGSERPAMVLDSGNRARKRFIPDTVARSRAADDGAALRKADRFARQGRGQPHSHPGQAWRQVDEREDHAQEDEGRAVQADCQGHGGRLRRCLQLPVVRRRQHQPGQQQEHLHHH